MDVITAGDDPAHRVCDCLYMMTHYIAIKFFWNLHHFEYDVTVYFIVKKKKFRWQNVLCFIFHFTRYYEHNFVHHFIGVYFIIK